MDVGFPFAAARIPEARAMLLAGRTRMGTLAWARLDEAVALEDVDALEAALKVAREVPPAVKEEAVEAEALASAAADVAAARAAPTEALWTALWTMCWMVGSEEVAPRSHHA